MWWRILQVGPTIAIRVALPQRFQALEGSLVSALSLIMFELNYPTSFPPFAPHTLWCT